MELKNLVSFQTIAEAESFSKAALLLGYAQSTISFQIKQLETELGVPLFDRINNGIRLTDSGQVLLDYTHQILSLSEQARQAITQESVPAGILRIAGISSLCASILPDIIKRYNEQFPAVTVSVITSFKSEILEKVNNGAADIGLYMDFELPPKEIYETASIENPLCFICSDRNELGSRGSLSIRDLAGIPLIATEPQCCYREVLTSLYVKNGIDPTILFESENTEVIKRFVQSNIGISFLPEIAVRDEITSHRLQKIDITDSVPVAYINVIHNKNQWMKPSVREFFRLVGTSL